jgi:hypothetical protein
VAVINYRSALKNKHKLRCIVGKLDNRLASAAIIEFPIYILAICNFLKRNNNPGRLKTIIHPID